MRIGLAWLDPSDPTDWAVACGLHRELKRLGHEAVVIGPRRRRGERPTERREGILIRRFGAGGSGAIARFADEHGVDAWHFHVFGRDARPFLAAVRNDGRPLAASLHLILPDYLPHLGGRTALKEIVRRAAAVTTVSAASRRELLSLHPELAGRASVVYNGPGVRAKPAAAAPSSPYVLCVARLAPYKGTDVLLMAFAHALKDAPELRLVLCGRDQLDGRLERFIARLGLRDRVTLTGGLSPAKVAGLLRGCRIFALPSRRENFPLALLEAMAAGKPCVASAVGGVPEMIRHGRDGLLVPAENAGALTRAMVRLATDAGLRRRLGSAARRRSGEWGWKRAAAGYASIYEALARSTAAGVRRREILPAGPRG